MKGKISYLMFALLAMSSYIITFAQKTDSTLIAGHFGGAVSLTNNGISLIPNLTLGKPAVIFDMSVGKRKLSFEPQLRFACEGKPWTFIFWWRYKLLENARFRIIIGTHPALAFKTESFTADGNPKKLTIVRRYLAGEFYPSYNLTKSINTGIYYLYAFCLENDAIKNTNFLALRVNFSHIGLSGNYFLRFNPQIYFLKMDEMKGYYFTSAITLVRKNFPLTVSSMMSLPFNTFIHADKDFVWNVSVVYSFNKEYIERKILSM